VREFPGTSRGARKTKEKVIRFICLADAADEPNLDGYWMKLSQWNRYRNDTFKDRRDDDLPSIPAQAPAAEGGVAVKVPQTPSIKTVFTLTRIKREDTRTTSTVLFVTLNKKTHTVSVLELHCTLSTEHSECTQHSVHNKS